MGIAVEVDYVAGTYTVFGPDGQTYLIIDTELTTTYNNMNYAWYQCITPLAFYAYLHAIGIGPSTANAHAALGLAAPSALVGPLYGAGFTKQTPFSLKLTGGGNAWFSVLQAVLSTNRTTASEFIIGGRLRIDATDGTYYQNLWEFDITAVASIFVPANPILTHKHGVQTGKNIGVTQARLSISPTFAGPVISLDLFVANPGTDAMADPMIVNGVLEGYGAVVGSPVRNAVSLGGTPATLNFVNG
jgi:hypothetical protein